MTTLPLTAREAAALHYPESDGNPIADNTLQFRWIMTIQGGLAAQYADRPDVFVAGDLLWYPVEGDNRTRVAPDVLVAFGRPKGERGSYLQWLEGDTPPQVVFEILSPGNRPGEMRRKREFYERFGVEEYYLYDPELSDLGGWVRGGDEDGGGLRSIERIDGWVSPRLGVRFETPPGEEMRLYHPDGEPFKTFVELAAERDAERRARAFAEAGRERAEVDRERAEAERAQAEAERAQAEAERDAAARRAEQLAARLRALGIDPDAAG